MRRFGLVLLLSSAGATRLIARETPIDFDVLRVCADPNNMPFSNERRDGFENKLADLIAARLKRRVVYEWWAQRRGFIRHTLNSGSCDVVMGVPLHDHLVDTTQPYYRSTYVFVTRADRHLDLRSLRDPRLRHLKIGIHLIGADGSNTPPAHALGEEGIVDNVEGFTIYGDYRKESPPSRLVAAVADGRIDVAAAWGPMAGYEAKISKVPLTITPIEDDGSFAPLKFQFDISMGVRKGDLALKRQLDDALAIERSHIQALLDEYGVPTLPASSRGASSKP